MNGPVMRARVAICCVAVLVPAALVAQDTPPTAWGRGPDAHGVLSGGAPAWLGAWSPLRPIADVPRGLLRAPLAPGLLDAPAPMAGAFVLAGAPGALARDLSPRSPGDTSRFSALRLRGSGTGGDFIRPLDVADSRVVQLSGQGWSPVGSRGVAIGRFVLDREQNNISSFTQRVAPYGSSPFVLTDSVRPPMQSTRARLEGALGLRVGGFGLGVSAAIDTREQNSIDFPLRRSGRAATPAATLGVERALPWLQLRVGGFYRWSEPNETNVLNAAPLPTVIYAVQGYDEPVGLPVGGATPVFVRNDRRATARGATLEFAVIGTRVVMTHEQGERAEDQYRDIASRARPTDRWRATGGNSRVLVQRAMGSRVRAMLVGSRESLDGTAVRADLTGIAFEGRDTRHAIEGDARMQLARSWSAALLGGATQMTSERVDYVSSLRSRVEVTTPFVGAELARHRRTAAFALGVSAASTLPSGAVPSVEREANYRRLIAPMLAYDAAEAQALAAWATALVPIGGTTFVASVRAERTTPRSVMGARLQPSGDRTGWSVMLGVRR